MSLVAYGTSSDEDSDVENSDESTNTPPELEKQEQPAKKAEHTNRKTLNLPQPARSHDTTDVPQLKLNLPKPVKLLQVEEEQDDEFLHKKVKPSLIEKPSIQNVKRANVRQPVKITIPSLSELEDDAITKENRLVTVAPHPSKPNGLLSLLPAPKVNAIFTKSNNKLTPSLSATATTTTKTTSLIPHSVSNKLKENELQAKSKKLASRASATKTAALAINYDISDDSENDDDDGEDFFSLNNDEKLPEVCASEINDMVAKKAAKMAELSRKLDREAAISDAAATSAAIDDQTMIKANPSTSSKLIGRAEADIQALCGTRAAKRARTEDIQFIEITQDQVTLSREEWLRNQLQSETEYQPTGRLLGDPGAGTKKKHQITYLAYQAKANEQELQAMWAANRNSRRQTQSKYGF